MSDYMRNKKGEEADNFFCRFSFGQFFALLVLEVFTLFFVFYLGARYGREFLGMEKAPVSAIEGESATQTQAPAEEQVISTTDPGAEKVAKELIEKAKTPELKERIAKMFEEAKGNNNPPPIEAASPPQTEAHPVTGPVEQVQNKPVEETPLAAQQQTAPQQALDAAAKETAPAKGSFIRVKSGDNAKYSIQIGSYPKLDEASKIEGEWKEKGYPAYIMIADIPDRGRWYRVRIGGFESRQDAGRYLTDLKGNENVEALIVQNEQ